MKKNSLLHYAKQLCFLFILICCASSNLRAQFITPTNSDNPVSSGSTSITHTNCDFWQWGSSVPYTTMKAIVYDGTNTGGPGLYWDYEDGTNSYAGHRSIGNFQNGAIPVNPDVAMNADASWLVVVYQDAGNGNAIIAEAYQWDYVNHQYNYYSTYSQVIFAEGANPKISSEKKNNDNFAIVYMKEAALYGAIYTCAGVFDPTSHYPIYYDTDVIVQDAGGNAYSYANPDVSVLEDNVYYTFTFDNGTDSYLYVEVQAWSDVKGDALSSSSTAYELRYTANGYVYSKPRIEANNVTNMLSYQDWVVVAEADHSGTTEIHSFVKYKSTIPTSPYVCNDGSLFPSGHDITGVPNSEPAVSYTGDYITFLWTVDNTSNVNGYSSIVKKDVVALVTWWDGTYLVYPSHASPDYLIANKFNINDQFAPSVAGRATRYFLSAWFNNDAANSREDVWFKSEEYTTNPQYRQKQVTDLASLKVYPNPVQDKLTIEFPLNNPNTDNSFSLTITDVLGNTIIESTEIREEKISWNVIDIAEGMYFLKVFDANHQVIASSKVIKQ